jgi:hypothetical protein
MSNDKIPGVPEGWELVRIGKPEIGEWFIDGLSEPYQAIDDGHFRGCAIIRKIEKPAKYRPFANAEEFKPHRDRWIRQKESDSIFRVITYDEDGLFALIEIVVDPFCWEEAFEDFVFDDDGTPFGVRIDE